MKNEVSIPTNTEFKLNLSTKFNTRNFRDLTLMFQCATLFETQINSKKFLISIIMNFQL